MNGADQPNYPRHTLRWLMLIPGVSLVVGVAGAAFLHSLTWVATFFSSQHWLIFLLPAFGLLSVWAYETFARSSAGGVRALISQIKQPTGILPAAKGPMIFATTLLSHLGGASVGREGTALQLGGSLADQFSRFFDLSVKERQTLLLCGVSAGFAAVFGTPIAAAIFALEFVKFRTWQILPCLACAFLADLAGRTLLHAHHANYRLPLPAELSLSGAGTAVVLGLACGLVARLYLFLIRRNSATKSIPNPYTRIFFGGIIFALLIHFGHLFDFTGLGLNVINDAFVEPVWPAFFILKFLLTFLCVSYGFRGGEVTPLFFIGVTLGSAAAAWLNLPLPVCAALGFVGVFAGAGAVPIACTVMAYELFGPPIALLHPSTGLYDPAIGLYAALACATSWLVAGRKGLYNEA